MQYVIYLYLTDYVGGTKLHLERKFYEDGGKSAYE